MNKLLLFAVVLSLFTCGFRFLSADPVISEFMADNKNTIVDEDGDSSDWIEIYNPGEEPVSLAGWYLTDNPDYLDKWSFPDVTLGGGGYLLVFASGKDRQVAGQELHTNFRLNVEGEYLALVKPDGQTIVHEYAPEFPEQMIDYSYGIGQDMTIDYLVPPDTHLYVKVPGDDSLGKEWTEDNGPFDPSTWIYGKTAVGYVKTVDGFYVKNYKSNINVSNLSIAEEVIGNPDYQTEVRIENAPFIDYFGTGGAGHYDYERPFPGTTAGVDEDDFVIEATGIITIPSAGPWTFGVLSDDGFELDLTNGVNSFRIEYPNPRGPGDTLGVFNVTTPGSYQVRLVMYEHGGGSSCELYAAQGSYSSWNTNFDLIGDTDEGGLAVQSEVASSGAVSSFSNYINTDVEDIMFGVNATAYIRIPFTVDDPGVYDSLFLRVKYDDGFVAYLNGVEVGRRNAPESLSFDSRATSDRPSSWACRYEDINISEYLNLLNAGDNLLAVQALNDDPGGGDFLFHVELADITIVSGVENFLEKATPGEANTNGFLDIVRDTKFSVDRGFYDAPFDVEITTETVGAQIRYTLDGSRPSADRGLLYSGPVHIDATTVLRCIAFKDDYIPTNVDTQTYIFLDDIIQQDYQAVLDKGFPTAWGSTAPDYGMDMKVIGQSGTDNYGGKYADTIKDDLLSIPTMSIVANVDDLFGPNGIYTNSTSRGVAWERPASLELIYPDGTKGFQEDAGIRMQGGYFRNHGPTRKHSFRFIFKAIYGATKLKYPLFGDEATDSFDTITLRANANDAWRSGNSRALYIRDSWGRDTFHDMGDVSSHEIFVHLYINGVYWGLYNPVERPDASFSATYFGGDKDTWDSLNQSGVSSGNFVAWNTMVDMANSGLETTEAYQRIQGNNPDGTDNPEFEDYIDLGDFIDYMITNIYDGNTDWPHNNYWMARNRVDSTGFKFYMWDSEFGLGLVTNLNTNNVDSNRGVAQAWMPLRENEDFRRRVGDRIQKIFFDGGPLYVDPSNPTWDQAHPERNRPAARFKRLADTVDQAMVAESARWGDQDATVAFTRDENWRVERDRILNTFFPQRSQIVLQQFRDAGLYPTVDAPVFNQHGGVIASGFVLFMSAPDGVTYYTFDGSDPRASDGSVNPSAAEAGAATKTVFIAEDVHARILVPVNGDLGLNWTKTGFDDSQWREGGLGVGYEAGSGYESFIATDLEAELHNNSTSVYLRIPFYVESPSGLSSLTLGVRYDDGFVAYINGDLVASRNAPVLVQWNSSAVTSCSDSSAVNFENINISGYKDSLQPGWNVLAVQGLNIVASSSDMLIWPKLQGAQVTSEEGIVLEDTAHVKARTLRSDGKWSALEEAIFHVYRPLDELHITEVMYHHADKEDLDGDLLDFIEFKNTGDKLLDLSGVAFTKGIKFIFPEGATLKAGEIALLVSDLSAFKNEYPGAGLIMGTYDGKLSNSGETITLSDPQGGELISFDYDNSPPWPSDAAGRGYSLVPVDPDGSGDPNLRTYWRASSVVGGTPGEDDEGESPGGWQLPGDSNQDSNLDLSDAINILLYLFDKLPFDLPCDGTISEGGGNLILLDVNQSQQLDLADCVYLLTYLFNNGEPPVLGSQCVRIKGCPDSCTR